MTLGLQINYREAVPPAIVLTQKREALVKFVHEGFLVLELELLLQVAEAPGHLDVKLPILKVKNSLRVEALLLQQQQVHWVHRYHYVVVEALLLDRIEPEDLGQENALRSGQVCQVRLQEVAREEGFAVPIDYLKLHTTVVGLDDRGQLLDAVLRDWVALRVE